MDDLALLRVALALLAVVGLLLALAWLARRSGYLTPLKRNARISTLETRRLGPRNQLCLIRVDDTELLLGLTAQHICVLHQIEGPREQAEAATEQAFYGHLQAARQHEHQP